MSAYCAQGPTLAFTAWGLIAVLTAGAGLVYAWRAALTDYDVPVQRCLALVLAFATATLVLLGCAVVGMAVCP